MYTKWVYFPIFTFAYAFIIFLAFKLSFIPLLLAYILVYLLFAFSYIINNRASELVVALTYFLPLLFAKLIVNTNAPSMDIVGLIIDIAGSLLAVLVLATIRDVEDVLCCIRVISVFIITIALGIIYVIFYKSSSELAWFFKILALDPIFIFNAYWTYLALKRK
jgi:hypothetical protein